jgi:predicted nucleotidyltransferase
MIERTDNPNLAILEIAVEALGNLSDSLVFVGGCATGLLVTRVRVNQIRATKDVDVVTRVAKIAEYHAIETQLTARGFNRTPHRMRLSAVGSKRE